MAEAQDDYPAHGATYDGFQQAGRRSRFCWIVLLWPRWRSACVGHLSLLALVLGVGGSVALLIGFAVLS